MTYEERDIIQKLAHHVEQLLRKTNSDAESIIEVQYLRKLLKDMDAEEYHSRLLFAGRR